MAMDVEYITNGVYKLKLDVDRKAFLKIYFTSVLAAQTEIADELKMRIETAIANLSTAPTTTEIDAIYALFKENKPEDKWDGMALTFTYIQQNGMKNIL